MKLEGAAPQCVELDFGACRGPHDFEAAYEWCKRFGSGSWGLGG